MEPRSYTPASMDRSLVLGVVLVALGYLIGSLPMGVLVARLTGGRDPRTVGSGRTGGTNALRAMGPWRALAVGLLDIAKGAVPVLLARVARCGRADPGAGRASRPWSVRGARCSCTSTADEAWPPEWVRCS